MYFNKMVTTNKGVIFTDHYMVIIYMCITKKEDLLPYSCMNEERRGMRVRFVYERLLRPKSVLRRTATQSTEEHRRDRLGLGTALRGSGR